MASQAIGTRQQERPLGPRRAGQTGSAAVSSILHSGSASIVISGQSRSDQWTKRNTAINQRSNCGSSNHISDSRQDCATDIISGTSSTSYNDRLLPCRQQGSQGDRGNYDHHTSTSGHRKRPHHNLWNDKQHTTYGESFDETDGGPQLQHGLNPGFRTCDGQDKTVEHRPSPLHQQGASNSKHYEDESRVDSGFHEEMEEDSSSSEEDIQRGIPLGHNTCRNRLDEPFSNSSPEESQLSKRQQKRQRKRARQRESSTVNETQIPVRVALREENERLKQQIYCRVCMDAPVGAMLLPCKHTVLCSSCSQRLNHCPVCRANITNRITVYLSGC